MRMYVYTCDPQYNYSVFAFFTVILFIIIFKAPLVNDLSLRERSVREPATTGMHRNIGVGIDPHGGFRTGTSQSPRECMGIFGWELATTGIPVREPATTAVHGNIWVGTGHHGNARERWMGTPIQRCAVCFELFFSVSHEGHETTE